MATAEPMLHKYKELLFVIIYYSLCRFVFEDFGRGITSLLQNGTSKMDNIVQVIGGEQAIEESNNKNRRHRKDKPWDTDQLGSTLCR
jgi:hypothetical protein